MSKHIADHDHASQACGRARHYIRIERDERPKTGSKLLQRRPENREAAARLRAYARIERRG